MPSLLDPQLRASLPNAAAMPHIAHFSDRFRDVVKGRTAAHEVGIKGYASGDVSLLDIMKNCLSGSINDAFGSQMFQSPQQVINYVECHDNMSAWDKLKDTREIRVRRMAMLNACVLLAQGVPFLHCGQEFARTKHGLHNTYQASDAINMVDYDRRDRYLNLVEQTKALITLRRNYESFRYSTSKEIEEHVSFMDLYRQVLIYQMQDEQGTMQVILNPTMNTFVYELKEEYQVLFYNGSVQPTEFTQNLQIEAVSTIVVWKNKV
ncbi:MAG: type I pullulanase, partial [Longicatena sp.]